MFNNKDIFFSIIVAVFFLILSYFIPLNNIIIFYIIIVFLHLIYLILEFFIFIQYIRNKFETPFYYPDFIRQRLLLFEDVSKANKSTIRIFVNLFFKNILVYVVLLLFTVFYYFFLF